MKKFIACMVLALFALTGTACAEVPRIVSGPSVVATWRYKMTVEVETPEGLKTGSVVREVEQKGTFAKDEKENEKYVPSYPGLKGEAVVVDLGTHGVLFGLLKGYRLGDDYARSIAGDTFFPDSPWNTLDGAKQMQSFKGGPVDLSPERYPVFVTFKNPSDPKTVENLIELTCPDVVVHAHEDHTCVVKDHFEEAFGQGVHLKSVSIEMTDESVTHLIDKYMPKYDDKPHFVNLYDLKTGVK